MEEPASAAARPRRQTLLPLSWSAEVRDVPLRERAAAGLALAHAFAADPLSVYLLDDDGGGCTCAS